MKAVLLQEHFLMMKSLETFFDIFWFPLMSALAFGFFVQYFQGGDGNFAQIFLVNYIMWEVFRVNQYLVTVGAMWNIWSHNLTNVFITPITFFEYFLAKFFSAMIMVFAMLLFINTLISIIFDISVFSIGLANLFLQFINLVIFGTLIGMVLLGVIFKYGTKIQAFTWGLIFLLQPIVAVFYPVSILPPFLQKIAYAIPVTYVFEAVRLSYGNGNIAWQQFRTGFILNMIYLAIAIVTFNMLLKSSMKTGQFVKNDEG